MAGIETIRQKRIVVIVGKSGAGKSTVANQFSNYGQSFQVRRDYQSVTEDVQYIEVEVDNPNQEERDFTFRIIDTAGFSGTNKTIKNPKVLEQIKNFFQVKAPEGVHLVLFVFSGGSGIRFTNEEREAFDFLKKNFEKEISGASALVLTHCESLCDKGRCELVKSFKTNELTKQYAKIMGKGILTVGFPDLEAMLPQLKETYKQTMKRDKKELIDLVISSSTIYLGNEMFKKPFWEKLRMCTIL